MKTKEVSINTPGYHYSNAECYTILLLDDEPDVTAILKKGLEAYEHFEVDAFTDPEEALKSVSTRNYDLLIVDIRLPKMDGFEFYRRARQMHDSKVILITASDKYHEEYQKRFPEWNGNCFVLKPISLPTLSTLLINELASTTVEWEPYN